jgi:ABC-type xylose transport system permease subunit
MDAHLLDLGDAAASSSGFELEWIALAAFVGITAFCALQAVVAPRRTFCSQEMPEPLKAE